MRQQLRGALDRTRTTLQYLPERTQVVIAWVFTAALFVLTSVLDDHTHGFWHGVLWDALWFMTGASALVAWQHRRR